MTGMGSENNGGINRLCMIYNAAEMESGMGREDELRMTYSGLLLKDGEKMVRVCFERGANDFAEGIVPKGNIVKSSGFSQEEIQQLSVYIQDNATDIIKRAKDVNFLNDWLGKKK